MKRIRDVGLVAIVVALIAIHFQQAPIQAATRDASTTQKTADTAGAESYAQRCAICHGDSREGILPAFPPLQGINRRMIDAQITEIIHSGKDRMPGFADIKGEELAGLLHYLKTADESSAKLATSDSTAEADSGLTKAGGVLYRQNCAFCHGRDTTGGESGPDLTQSKIVLADVNGDKISQVVREGRPEKKMPAFNFSGQEMRSLTAFIHEQLALAATHKGDRRGVDVADLQTGNAAAGKQYFNGAGTCAKCHSPAGDLAGVATRYEGLHLEERMLYPRGTKSKITVTLSSGEKLSGTLAYLDEFTVGLLDASGTYHSWLTNRVKYAVDSPVEAHVDLFGKYTDDDIHNLMAYLQTLR
jgi:mono/diheme cytochrome c family protein